jgi:signal transduction histidine kinase
MARLIRTAHWAQTETHPDYSGMAGAIAMTPAAQLDERDDTARRAEAVAFAAPPPQSLALRKADADARAAERRRISRLLHDEVGQSLTALTVKLAVLRARTSGPVQSELLQAHKLLEKTLGQLQRLSKDIYPSAVEDLGLVPALRSCIQGFSGEIAVQLRAQDSQLSIIEPDVAVAVFRSVETLLGELREAAAAKAVLTILVKDEVLQLQARAQISNRGPADAVPDVRKFQEQVLIAGGTVKCRASRNQALITAEFPITNQGTV